jgi:hypothetical protein
MFLKGFAVLKKDDNLWKAVTSQTTVDEKEQ